MKNSLTIKIIKLSFPVMIGMMMHSLLTFSDRYFVALLGINEAAGTNLTGTLFWVLISFTAIVSGGTTAIVSRKIGEKNKKEVEQGIHQSIMLSIIIGLIIFLSAYLTVDIFFNFFNAEKNVAEIGIKYYSALLFSYPFLMISVVINSIFQAIGDTKTPMIIFSAMSLTNLALDPIFIFGIGDFKGWGVEGAAWATTLAEVLALIWMFYRLKKITSFNFKFKRLLIIDILMMKRILKIGFWSGMNSFSRPLSGILLQKIVTVYGTNAIAAFGFGHQWLMILFIFLEGIKVATATLIGQALGMKDQLLINKIIKRSFFIASVFVIPLLILSIIFRKYEIMIFSSNLDVIKIGTSYIVIVMSSMIFVIPAIIFYAVFNGAGDTAPPMVISFIGNWPGKIMFAAVTTYILDLSIEYVWYSIALSVIIEGIGMTIWFKRDKWRHKVV